MRSKKVSLQFMLEKMPPVVFLSGNDRYNDQETYTNLKRRYLSRLMKEGRGPVFFKMGKQVAFRSLDLISWLEGRAKGIPFATLDGESNPRPKAGTEPASQTGGATCAR